jgi:hypothetical protein
MGGARGHAAAAAARSAPLYRRGLSGLRVEPPALAGHVPERQEPTSGANERPAARPSFDLIVRPERSVLANAVRGAVAHPPTLLAWAGLGASAVGLLGVDSSLVWLVAGVWTVRAMAGTPVGAAWGIACLAVGLRWGTTSLGEVTVATRVAGPTILAGPALVRIGVVIALAGAILDETNARGLREGLWIHRAAAGIAIAALVPLFVVRGPADPRSALPLLWGGAAAAAALAVLLVSVLRRRLPTAVPILLSSAGVVVLAMAR